ncbi:hypothetical protein DBR32_14015 [Taibaiella sp. KBW10]|uniref:hypothetical protein n=1 Tax=Taibaiella sp. KBW10 TaxID=2153357 RepID=UPI000F59A56F|nr:hypothetical protein [Taibaiella sp. KBW10]RQO30017.1 hypothetical protein DBR32_14015 [Taibaiella sp. KBW10]
MKKLFLHQDIRQLYFLDDKHALAFTRQTVQKGTNAYEQGIYYLLKNKQVVDSFKTPEGVYYNDNYNGNQFTRLATDTAVLGIWGIIPEKAYGTYDYTRLLLIAKQGEWHFAVKKVLYEKTLAQYDNDTLKNYRHFQLRNGKKLLFNHNSGTFDLDFSVVEEPYLQGIYVLENEQQIVLIDRAHEVMWISFDGGLAWYIYPKLTDRFEAYSFLKLDDNDILSYFKINYNPHAGMQKMSYRFRAK